jgi:hypothetical protein
MTFNKLTTIALVSAAMLGSALMSNAHAQAVQLEQDGTGFGMSSGGLTLPLGTANFWSGFQKINVGTASNTFQAFCIDPAQWASTAWTGYTQTTLNPTFSSVAITNITKLFNYGFSGADDTNLNAAAFQLALWEVANDDGDLSTGFVQKTSNTKSNLVTATDTLLANYGSASSTSLYNFSFYKSKDNQDFIVATPVPELESYAMMLAGLGLMGTIARRRKAKAAETPSLRKTKRPRGAFLHWCCVKRQRLWQTRPSCA